MHVCTDRPLSTLIRMGLVKSAHDCSEGGLAVALAESCMSGSQILGATAEIPSDSLRADVPLFNESQSRIVLSVDPANTTNILALLAASGVPARQIGIVTDSTTLKLSAAGKSFSWPLADLHKTWSSTIDHLMEG